MSGISISSVSGSSSRAFFDIGGGFERIGRAQNTPAQQLARNLSRDFLQGSGLKAMGGPVSRITSGLNARSTSATSIDVTG